MLDNSPNLIQSSSIGNAGEYLVAAHLLMRRYHGGLADRGNRAFDLIIRKGNAFAGIRVKTSTHSATRFTWTCKKSGEVFLEIGERDFVVMVYLPDCARALLGGPNADCGQDATRCSCAMARRHSSRWCPAQRYRAARLHNDR